jgi:hypothetical protein
VVGRNQVLENMEPIKGKFSVDPTTLSKERSHLETMVEIVDNYKSANSSEEENKYATMFKDMNPILRPFEYTHHENQNDIIARKKVHANIFAIVNNNDDFISYVSRGKGSTSEQGQSNTIEETTYFTQQYIPEITNLHKENITGSQLITTKKTLMQADELELKSIMTFPEPLVRFSRINLPGTNILIKSNLNSAFFKYWDFFSKKLTIQEKMASTLQTESEEQDFFKIITNYKINMNSELTKNQNYKKYIDTIIPTIKRIFNIMKKYMNSKLSIVDVVSYLEPFLIYTDDLTYAQYKEITKYIYEKITEYNKSFILKKNFFKQYLYKYKTEPVKMVELFKNQNLMNQIFNKYDLFNESNIFFTNQELLAQLVNLDFGNLYNTFYSKQNIELMFPNDMTNIIENINKEFEKEDKSKCKNYIIAKKYYTIKELENDNQKNIYFDRQFDNTNYGVLDSYEKERSKMQPEHFFIFLQDKLKNKMKLNDVESNYLTETIINGMRRVLDGYYAILIDVMEYKYYIRKNNVWELAKEVDPNLISTSENMLCNLQLNCISKENTCQNTSDVSLSIKQQFIKNAIDEFDKKYAISKEAFTQMLDIKMKYYQRIVPKMNEIETHRFLQYNNIKYNIGLTTADDSSIAVSPHASLLRHILGMDDIEKQQMYIIKFVKMFTEQNIEDPHWLYCNLIHVKLIPKFLYTIARYYNTPQYDSQVNKLKLEIGKLSDDGDSWVDKHSGYVIEKINFNIDESYEEGQQRIKTRDSMLEKEYMGDTTTTSVKNKMKLNPQSELISNIITTISREMGINIESERDFIITIVNTVIQEHLKKEKIYAKMMQDKANKGTIIPSYKQYYNDTILFATFGTFLISVQISIPSVQTRKTFPGCVKSFDGYPFDGVSDFSALTYISCVGHKLRANVEPWSVLQKKTVAYVYDKIKLIIDTILLELPEIKRKIMEKVEYLLKRPDTFISEEYSLTKWREFLPPLVEIHIKHLQYISPEFEKSLLDDIKHSTYKQREKILVIESKVIQYSLAIQEKIQTIVKKQALLLQSYLENACCMDNKTLPIIEYFKQKDVSIEIYNNNVINLSKILKDIRELSTAVMISSKINSKIIYPTILKIFSEETIYLAFIYFCKFKTNSPMNEAYLSVCTSKPEINEKDKDDNIEIIRKMKLSGTEYSSEHFLRLLQLVNRQNIVDINVSFPVIEPLIHLFELLVSINATENDDGITLLLKLIESENDENSIDEANRTLSNYVSRRVSDMKTTILDYIRENSKQMTKNKFKVIETFINSGMKSDSDSKMEQLTFFKSYAKDISRVFPNIILNKINYKEVKIPIYWDLSTIHNADIQRMIYDYYSQLVIFYNDETLSLVLSEIKQSCINLLLVINEIYYYERLPNRTVELLVQYFFLKIFIKYIDLSQDPTNIFHKEEEAERQNKEDERDERDKRDERDERDEDEEEYELESRDDEIMIRGNQKKLRGKVAELLIVYINIMTNHKKDNDISYDEVSDMVFKIKQREKNSLTDKLKEKDDEGRNIDNLFKKYKLGDWNKGLQKGLTEYVAEEYDNTLEETDKYQQYEKQLRNNETHGNNYNDNINEIDDFIAEQQLDEEIDNENRDMAFMNEDYMDGDYYGDEVGENMNEYD